jgi:hypothetical protein
MAAHGGHHLAVNVTTARRPGSSPPAAPLPPPPPPPPPPPGAAAAAAAPVAEETECRPSLAISRILASNRCVVSTSHTGLGSRRALPPSQRDANICHTFEATLDRVSCFNRSKSFRYLPIHDTDAAGRQVRHRHTAQTQIDRHTRTDTHTQTTQDTKTRHAHANQNQTKPNQRVVRRQVARQQC